MDRMLKFFEHTIVFALIGMMVVVVSLATFELGWIIVRDMTNPPNMMIEIDELLDIFGFFLLVLIGLELLETIKVYLLEHVIHVEIVLEVALIAIARKVIILDPKDYSPITLLGIAALIATLAIAIYIEQRTHLAMPLIPRSHTTSHSDTTLSQGSHMGHELP